MALARPRPLADPRPLTRRAFLRAAAALAAGAALGAPLAGCSTGAASPSPSVAAEEEETAPAAAAGAADEPVTRTFFAFDTVITLTLYADEALADDLEERCAYFEEHFSRTLEGTDVWRINHAGGAPVTVAPETADIIDQALAYCEASDGLFDITIGAVSSLWDFKEGIKPADQAVTDALAHVDWRGVRVEGDTVTLADPEAMIDLGGIAKGYIADDLTARIRAAGCEHAIVNLGGNVAVVGSRPDGRPWNVGIQDPNAATGAGVIAAVPAADASVVTSGLYERSFTEDGVRYHHILDPRTGYPAQTDLVSSSIAGSASTDCDALATWIFLLGAEGALRQLEVHPDVEGLLIDDTAGALMTENAAFELR